MTHVYALPRRTIRLLPVTIASLCLLFVAKIYDVVETGNQFSQLFLSTSAQAEPPAAKEEKEAASTKETTEKTPETLDIASVDPEKAATEDTKPEEKREFSEIEIDILQSLAKRREELEKLEEQVRLKESVLESTEVRLDEKISQIGGLEKTVRELLTAYDKEEEAKIASLVKIYENMKPKDAARIFDELEMSILLMVVDRMTERKAAPILAKMSPLKAKSLTEELAEDRKLRSKQEATLNEIAPPAAPQPAPPAQ
jgi:flagellar motility protein MotE (MotC chaperone)